MQSKITQIISGWHLKGIKIIKHFFLPGDVLSFSFAFIFLVLPLNVLLNYSSTSVAAQ